MDGKKKLIADFEDLRKNLLELRSYYYNMGRNIYERYDLDQELPEKDAFKAGKSAGALEVIEALILACYGGKYLFTLHEMSWEAAALSEELNDGLQEGEEE